MSKLQQLPSYTEYYNVHRYGYRCYQPLKPTSSRFLQLKWDSHTYSGHCQRITLAKSTVNTQPPSSFMHVQLNLKGLQMKQERNDEIMRNNEILLNRMAHVIHNETRLPNWTHCNKNSCVNADKRKKEMIRIMDENQLILKRIVNKDSHYNNVKWQKEWNLSRQYLHNISSYPTKC